jgi:hypothetical protein
MIWRLVRESLCERSSQDVAQQRAEGRARSASKPRLPARQAGTLAAELTRQCCAGGGARVRTCSLPLARRLLYRKLSYTPNEKIHPVTGSGAALSLRPVSAFEA